MLPPVFQTLKASADVKNFVGTNPPRIYRHGRAPEARAAGPYITWFVVVGTPENHLSGTPPTDRVSVQVDCWHDRDDSVEAMATAVRDAIEAYAHMTATAVDGYEPETKLFRMGLVFDWFHDRAA